MRRRGGRFRRTGYLLIKTVHTAAFAAIATSILVVLVDGVRARPGRRTGLASGIALAECAIFAGNGFVCPLTSVAERLGEGNGSVSDIFLPGVVARNLTWVSSLILVLGIALNLRALNRRSQLPPSGRPA